MIKQFLECGRIVTTQGLKGEVRVQPWSDTPGFLMEFDAFYLDGGAGKVEVEWARVQKNMAVIKLKGYDSVEDAVTLRNKILYIDREDTGLEDGEYFVQDLIGLQVRDIDSGRPYGSLTQVYQTGANDVYELTDQDGTKRLIPAIKDVVIRTDIEGGLMEIRPLAGLFEDAD